GARWHRSAERAPDAHDEAELELEVEALARAEARRLVRRLRLATRPRHRRPTDHDRPRAAVIADRKMAPVREERVGVGTKEPAEVRRMLERGVEVDVVRDLQRQMYLDVVERDQLRAAVDQLDDALDGPLPRVAPGSEEAVQARCCEHVVTRRRREIEDSIPDPEPDARSLTLRREHSEADRFFHKSIPSASSSPTGSKKLQLPIDHSRSRRACASSSGPASRSRHANDSASSRNAAASSSASAASSSPKTTAASRLRNPCSPSARTAWWRPAGALNPGFRSPQPPPKGATSATLGADAPPHRPYPPSPASRTASSDASSPSATGTST